MTLEEYRRKYGWTVSAFARNAGVDSTTVKKALKGDRITPTTAQRLVEAISKAEGRTLYIADIDGLNVSW